MIGDDGSTVASTEPGTKQVLTAVGRVFGCKQQRAGFTGLFFLNISSPEVSTPGLKQENKSCSSVANLPRG